MRLERQEKALWEPDLPGWRNLVREENAAVETQLAASPVCGSPALVVERARARPARIAARTTGPCRHGRSAASLGGGGKN